MAPDRAYLIVSPRPKTPRTPRRHRVGRHRTVTPGRRRCGTARPVARTVARPPVGRHAARRVPVPARYAPLAVALSTLLVSGWFAASGAAAFAAMVHP
jgi:hypothetical protein